MMTDDCWYCGSHEEPLYHSETGLCTHKKCLDEALTNPEVSAVAETLYKELFCG
jgi:hypothetical protein